MLLNNRDAAVILNAVAPSTLAVYIGNRLVPMTTLRHTAPRLGVLSVRLKAIDFEPCLSVNIQLKGLVDIATTYDDLEVRVILRLPDDITEDPELVHISLPNETKLSHLGERQLSSSDPSISQRYRNFVVPAPLAALAAAQPDVSLQRVLAALPPINSPDQLAKLLRPKLLSSLPCKPTTSENFNIQYMVWQSRQLIPSGDDFCPMSIALRLAVAACLGANSTPLPADEEVVALLKHSMGSGQQPHALGPLGDGVAISLPEELDEDDTNATARPLLDRYKELCRVTDFFRAAEALDTPLAIAEF